MQIVHTAELALFDEMYGRAMRGKTGKLLGGADVDPACQVDKVHITLLNCQLERAEVRILYDKRAVRLGRAANRDPAGQGYRCERTCRGLPEHLVG